MCDVLSVVSSSHTMVGLSHGIWTTILRKTFASKRFQNLQRSPAKRLKHGTFKTLPKLNVDTVSKSQIDKPFVWGGYGLEHIIGGFENV